MRDDDGRKLISDKSISELGWKSDGEVFLGGKVQKRES